MARTNAERPPVDLARIISWILRAVGLAAVTAAAGFSIWAWREGRATMAWTPRSCTILASEVGTSSATETGTSSTVSVRYRYTVDGQSYEGNTYAVASSMSDRRAREIVAGLPPGKETECYVDPANPEHAVLARGGHQAVVTFWIVAALIMVGLPALGVGVVNLWDRFQAAR